MYYYIMFLFKGWTPLMYAATHGRLDIVKFLANNEANLNDKGDDGKVLIISSGVLGTSMGGRASCSCTVL